MTLTLIGEFWYIYHHFIYGLICETKNTQKKERTLFEAQFIKIYHTTKFHLTTSTTITQSQNPHTNYPRTKNRN